MKPPLPDGIVAFVKRDCPTCELVVPVLEELSKRLSLTVYTQDDPGFPQGIEARDDTSLELSWHHQIEAVPTLLRVEQGVEQERVLGWHRDEWETLSGVRGMYVVNRGGERDGLVAENKRLNKVTIDHELIGDFARNDFKWAAGIALTSDETVFCADEYDNVIRIYSSDGEKLGEWGKAGSGEGEFNGPSGLAFDNEDNLYVIDSLNDRVQKYTRDGQFLSSWGSSGSGEGQFNRPWGITIDGNGDVYVVDWGNDRIQKFTPGGTFLRSFGSSSDEEG